ncbi:S10 family peptidase [Zhouia sp. PK063]|uniref:S10 family peptidase n=1 Tax=Zhouia sp. PK063 TaxID=3373602 RepID=UPI0037B7A353
MKKHLLLSIFFVCLTTLCLKAQVRKIPSDTTVTTSHETTILGKKVSYTATVGMQPVWAEDGTPIATLNYTYYKRTDVSDASKRPLIMSFNGGPGSGSVWMHLAYTGPNMLNIDNEGYPVQPYGYSSNPYSILDVADIVFINPVNTGYSRIIDKDDKKVDRSQFFGVNQDINYLAQWLNTFVTRNNRWTSPKYLIGESYGTTRVSGLALALQENEWMYLNGVILVSPTDLGISRDGAVDVANRLPYFAAAAWYHKALPANLQSKSLTDLLNEVEKYTIDVELPAIAKGSAISNEDKQAVAEKMSEFSGISKETILDHNLDISYNFFWKDLLRKKGGYTIGRLDSRYRGIDAEIAGERPDYNAELTSWLHSFTPAINAYMRDFLKFKTDVKYNMFGNVYPWDNTRNHTGENLREAMATNPYLHLMVQSGYFDGACTYFNAKYTMWQMDKSGRLKDRMSWKGYESGHMMYLRHEDLKQANQDIRDFIKASNPGDKPAKY